jgi:polyhydroxybutyrate depolymerase
MQGLIGGARPIEVKTPLNFKPQGQLYPLLILLHGFNADADTQDRYLGLSQTALAKGYIFAAPNGTPTIGTGMFPRASTRFWNASESCCDFTSTKVDDVTYLRDLIRQIIQRYPVDPGRVYLFGHSNGAFMAHRLACEEAPRITAIAALAGSLRPLVSDCKPKEPVAVLTIHGTSDLIIQFDGGQTLPTTPAYPSAMATLSHWAKLNSCASSSRQGEAFSVVKNSTRMETTPIRFDACAANGAAELWKIDQGGHIPDFDGLFVPRVLDFFEKHKK